MPSIASLSLSGGQLDSGDPAIGVRIGVGFQKFRIELEDVACFRGGFRSATLQIHLEEAVFRPDSFYEEAPYKSSLALSTSESSSSDKSIGAELEAKRGILSWLTLGLAGKASRATNEERQQTSEEKRDFNVWKVKPTVDGVWEIHGVDNPDGILDGRYLGNEDVCTVTPVGQNFEVQIVGYLRVFPGDFEIDTERSGGNLGKLEKIVIAKDVLREFAARSGDAVISICVVKGEIAPGQIVREEGVSHGAQ